jgi:hypothetical protein
MPNEPELPARDELQAAPPFLTWTGLYCVVAGVLLAEILLFTALTLVYR